MDGRDANAGGANANDDDDEADGGWCVDDVDEALTNELIKCEFTSVSKKPDAMLLANEMAERTNAAVAECVSNVALLYRPSPKKRFKI